MVQEAFSRSLTCKSWSPEPNWIIYWVHSLPKMIQVWCRFYLDPSKPTLLIEVCNATYSNKCNSSSQPTHRLTIINTRTHEQLQLVVPASSRQLLLVSCCGCSLLFHSGHCKGGEGKRIQIANHTIDSARWNHAKE